MSRITGECASVRRKRSGFRQAVASLDMMGACFRPTEIINDRTSYQTALLRRIEDYMREAILEPSFGPTSIAAAFGFSPCYLHRIFSDVRTTFSEWCRNERLLRAAHALTSPTFASESITQIASLFGFCDAAHSSKTFKLRYHQTPLEFRNTAKPK